MSREEKEPTSFVSVHSGDLVYVLDLHQLAFLFTVPILKGIWDSI